MSENNPTQPELWTALDRLRSGPGPKSDRYRHLSMESAVGVLRSGIEELIDLRALSRELLCPSCKTVTKYKKEDWQTIQHMAIKTCVSCGTVLQVYGHAQLKALRARVQQLESQVEHLEMVINAAFDLTE